MEDLEPLERVDDADAEDRVVAGVDVGHRGRVVGRRAEGERPAAGGSSSRRRASSDRTMIWTTAKLTEVSRRQTARPSRASGSGSARRATAERSRPGWRSDGSCRAAGRGRPATPARRGSAGRRRPTRPRARAARPRSKSAIRSSRSSSPTEHAEQARRVIPASARAASSSWRWVVDGGWTTIVKTLPSDAVRSGIVSASMNAPPPASRPPASSNASIPPPTRELAARDVALGMARRATGGRRATRRPDARARRPVPRPSPRGGPSGSPASRGRAGRGTPRYGARRGARCRPGRAGPRSISSRRPGDDAGQDVAVAGEVLRRRLDDEVGAELDRPAEVRRGERVVDDVASRRGGGRARRGRRGRRRRSSGSRSSRRRGSGSAPAARAASTAARSVTSTNVGRRRRAGRGRSSSCARVVPYDARRRDDPVAGRDERHERRVDRGHARTRGRSPASAPSSSATAAAERAPRRVVDPAVGVAGRLAGRTAPSSSASSPRTSPSGRSAPTSGAGRPRGRRWAARIARVEKPRRASSRRRDAGSLMARMLHRPGRMLARVVRPSTADRRCPSPGSCRRASRRTSPGRR